MTFAIEFAKSDPTDRVRAFLLHLQSLGLSVETDDPDNIVRYITGPSDVRYLLIGSPETGKDVWSTGDVSDVDTVVHFADDESLALHLGAWLAKRVLSSLPPRPSFPAKLFGHDVEIKDTGAVVIGPLSIDASRLAMIAALSVQPFDPVVPSILYPDGGVFVGGYLLTPTDVKQLAAASRHAQDTST